MQWHALAFFRAGAQLTLTAPWTAGQQSTGAGVHGINFAGT